MHRAGGCVYLSGSISAVPAALPVLAYLFPGRPAFYAPRLIGSSGGTVLAAFLSLGAVESEERRLFTELCTILSVTQRWADLHGLLRTWVREMTGGAACTMRQWSARFSDFHAIVYDYAQSRTRVISCSTSRHTVAFVLASCLLQGSTLAHSFPAGRAETWVNVEEILPASFLARCITPPPALHFTSMHSVESRGPTTTAELLNVQHSMLSAAMVHLTWTTVLPCAKRSLWSVVSPWWASFLTPGHPRLSRSESEEVVGARFALAFCAWVFVLLDLRTTPRREAGSLDSRPHAAPGVLAAVDQDDGPALAFFLGEEQHV